MSDSAEILAMEMALVVWNRTEADDRKPWGTEQVPDHHECPKGMESVYHAAFVYQWDALACDFAEIPRYNDMGCVDERVKAYPFTRSGAERMAKDAQNEGITDTEWVTVIANRKQRRHPRIGYVRGRKSGGTHTTGEGLRTLMDWIDDVDGAWDE